MDVRVDDRDVGRERRCGSHTGGGEKGPAKHVRYCSTRRRPRDYFLPGFG
jgi:hypothetical protein